jgi:hypothetical protein
MYAERLYSLEVNIIIYADGPSGIELWTLLSLPLPLLLSLALLLYYTRPPSRFAQG